MRDTHLTSCGNELVHRYPRTVSWLVAGLEAAFRKICKGSGLLTDDSYRARAANAMHLAQRSLIATVTINNE